MGTDSGNKLRPSELQRLPQRREHSESASTATEEGGLESLQPADPCLTPRAARARKRLACAGHVGPRRTPSKKGRLSNDPEGELSTPPQVRTAANSRGSHVRSEEDRVEVTPAVSREDHDDDMEIAPVVSREDDGDDLETAAILSRGDNDEPAVEDHSVENGSNGDLDSFSAPRDDASVSYGEQESEREAGSDSAEDGEWSEEHVHVNDDVLKGSKRKYTYRSREKRTITKSAMRSRWETNLTSMSDGNVARLKCCTSRKCFRHVNVSFLREKMKVVLSLNKESRRRTLKDMLGSNGNFLFDGKRICANFLVRAFRFSRDLQASVRNNSATIRHAASTARDTPPDPRSKDAVITFLERVAENSGDYMPDVEEVHLPFFRKTDVYDHFLKDYAKLHDTDAPSFNYFCEIWRRYCRTIKVRKVSRFAKCSRCEELRSAIEDAISNGVDTKDLRKQKAAHREFIQRERREYKKKRENAIINPEQFCSIIVDGADQSAFGLPHYIVKSKEARGRALKVKVVGLLEHGKPNTAFLFTLTEEHETGANHVVEAVHRFLHLRSQRGTLPRVFYVQVDNCTRENKNRYFLSYMDFLVASGVFDSVEVSFLPIGHTHEDVDQLFSRTSERLRSHNALTLSSMHSQLQAVYNTNTIVRHMKYIANWSGLCERDKVLLKVSHFSHYRYFSFASHQTGNGNNSTPTWCNVKVACKDPWRPMKTVNGCNTGFLSKVPDIRRIPSTKIVCPTGKAEVTKRIESEEYRINSTVVLRELQELRDHVFRVREDPFHWDLDDCVELKQNAGAGNEAGDTSSSEEEGEDAGRTLRTTDDVVRNDYEYEINSYVAVRTEEGDAARFWIGKVTDRKYNQSGVVYKLELHWLQLHTGHDSFEGRYKLGYLNNGSGENVGAYKSWVSSDTVLVSFQNMTRNGRIPVRAQKLLRTSGGN